LAEQKWIRRKPPNLHLGFDEEEIDDLFEPVMPGNSRFFPRANGMNPRDASLA
jgi:hypothetical protein